MRENKEHLISSAPVGRRKLRVEKVLIGLHCAQQLAEDNFAAPGNAIFMLRF